MAAADAAVVLDAVGDDGDVDGDDGCTVSLRPSGAEGEMRGCWGNGITAPSIAIFSR